MPTKPKHYAVFILNENGSGTVKQFDTWQEAKAAYAAESATGKAVYLYPQPMKAIGAGTTPIEAPAKTPVAFTAVQNTGAFAWPSHPPLPRPTAPGDVFSGSSDYERYHEWQAYCLQHPTHRECSIPGKPKFGTESLVCGLNAFGDTWTSTDGTEYPRSQPVIQLADGMGGTFPSDEMWFSDDLPFRKWQAPCEYPNGFREYQDFNITDVKELIFGTATTAPTVIAINRLAVMRASRKLMQYSGDVGSQVLIENGVLPRDVEPLDRELEINALREYTVGEPVFNTVFTDAAMNVHVFFPLKPLNDGNSEELDPITELIYVTVTETGNIHQVGSRTADVFRSFVITPSPDGPQNLFYDEEAGLGSGFWDVTMASPTELNFTFTPTGDTPADARPPAGWAGVVARGPNPDSTNPFGGDFEGVDTTGVPPGGTHQGPWVNDYFAANILLESDFDNHYYTNGTGGYFAIPIPPLCDPADTLVNENATEPITYDAGCGEWTIGTLTYNVYADGNCSFYDQSLYSTYNEGDIGTCNGNIYTVDSTGNVTSRPDCQDPELYSGQSGWSYDGCNWSYSEPCQPSGTDLGVDPYDSCNNVYADGVCGTYTSSNGSCGAPPCDSSGTDYGVDPDNSCQNVYADGNCGTYTSSNGSCDEPSCDSSGTYLGSGSEPTYYESSCGPMQTGETDYIEYADGSCGTYRSYSNMSTYYDEGTYLGECEGYNYYSVGNGGAYTA